MREISRAVGSPGHELMKKVSEILQPLMGTKQTFIRNGNDFIRKIKTGSHKRGFQVSFDVEALFPSIATNG